MNTFRKNIILFSLAAVLLMPAFSNAEITFKSSPSSQSINPGGILDNLPQPISDFIKGAKDIFGKYINGSTLQSPVNINLNQLKDVNVTQWFQNISQNGSFNELYQLIVKVFSLVGNLFVWILNIVIDLIRQGLALLH